MAKEKAPLSDRILAWLSPSVGASRARDRAILAYYEAARKSPLRKDRRSTGSGNSEILQAGSSLRQQARHAEQNHDLALGVLDILVTNIVGPTGVGVEPQPRNLDGSINDKLARQIQDLYTEWQKAPEVTRQHDWPSAQRLMARSWMRDGEVFAQMIAGNLPSLDHGTKVPFSLELLEADFVPMEMNSTSPVQIIQGVTVNAWGAPLGYNVFKTDPQDSLVLSSSQTKFIPASRMLHLKTVHRIRQMRGVSKFATVLTRFADVKDYEESERIAAKIAASMAAFIKKGNPELYNPEGADPGVREMKFRPGMVFDNLLPGEDIGTIDTNRPNANLSSYRNGQLRAIAAGTGPTFSSIAKTYEGSYSSQRQELVEAYAFYSTLSSEFTSRVVRPVYEQFLAAAIANGDIKVPKDLMPGSLTSASFMPPAMPWIDPLKEAKAWAELEDRCYISGPEIIRKRGGNPQDTLEQQGRWLREKRAEGIEAAPAPAPAPSDPEDPAQEP